MENPEVKILLNLKKDFIIKKAEELGLSTLGNKLVLARRVAQKQQEECIRCWKAISNGRQNNVKCQ